MFISLEWLKEFTDWPEPPAELAERLTGIGLAVAGMGGTPEAPVLELELTSNRPDCLSHYGVAREVAALAQSPLRAPEAPPSRAPAAGLKVVIESPEGCARYSARLLELPAGGASRPLPPRMRARLEAMGQAPIHLLPDLSNYTMFELGQPTHAFDADRLRGGELRVRQARPGESLVTLDEIERKLDPADLVIADAERPVALAGVIGGLETAISPATRRVAIESAWFEPALVRRAAGRHGLRTDAGYRFERGADPLAAAPAADRIAARAAELAGAAVVGAVDCVAREWRAPEIELSTGFLARLLGLAPPAEEIEAILRRLGFTVAPPNGQTWTVRAPSWRADIKIEAGLAAEVARMWGYQRIPARLPAFKGAVARPEPVRLQSQAREKLRGRGYSEAVSLSFAGEAECARFAPGRLPVRMLNPLNEEEAWLRTTLAPSLLRLLQANQNRDREGARLFEIGKVYARRESSEGGVEEELRLALGGYGASGGWNDRREYGFFELKGDIELLLAGFQLPGLEWRPAEAGWCHPGRAAEIRAGGRRLGIAAELEPGLAEEWKFRRPPLVAELDLEKMLAAGAAAPQFRPPSRYPGARRDFSFIFDERVSWSEIAAALSGLRQPGWQGAAPLEIFRGGNIPAGRRSILLRAGWQLDDRTLRDEEVQRSAEAVRAALTALGGQQR